MMKLPESLKNKIIKRVENNALRMLKKQSNLIDFSSNDYLGFSKSSTIFDQAHQFLVAKNLKINGATGSRLLSGNYTLYDELELFLAKYHQSESALLFNSGYDANIGFFSSVPQRGAIVLYDEFIHASIRDGIRMSNAKAFKFKHNSSNDLERLLKQFTESTLKKKEIYVVTEAIFSMDGDSPDLNLMAKVSKNYNAFFVVDEAHSVGVFGENGCGKIKEFNLQEDVFARIITFGKALGCHGAVILGSAQLKEYLINFSRSFIYTTSLPPHSLATLQFSYQKLSTEEQQKKLQENIIFFRREVKKMALYTSENEPRFIESHSAIHCCLLPGNENVKKVALKLQESNFDVKPILSPTVPKNKERLRFCLHSYNSKEEITEVLKLLNTFVKEVKAI